MTNERAEKQWQELVEPRLKELRLSNGEAEYGFEEGIQFVRANLPQLPEVREAISVIEAFKVYFETLNEGRHGYAQDKMRDQINDALKKLGGKK